MESLVVIAVLIFVGYYFRNQGVTRPSADASWAGVCAGLARHYRMTPGQVRILFVIFSLVGGAGLLTYFILWIMLPGDGV